MKIKADNSQVRESYYDRLAALRIPLLLMTRGSELIAAAPPPPPTVSSGSSARSQDQLSWWSWTGTLFFILLDCWKILLLKMSVFLMPYVQFKLNCLTSWKWHTSIPAVTAAAASIRFEIWRGRTWVRIFNLEVVGPKRSMDGGTCTTGLRVSSAEFLFNIQKSVISEKSPLWKQFSSHIPVH